MALMDMVQELLSATGRGLVRGLIGPAASSPVRTGGPEYSTPSTIRVGEVVSYRRGRGTFLARVMSVDSRRAKAVVQRLSDGKRVARPLGKLRARA